MSVSFPYTSIWSGASDAAAAACMVGIYKESINNIQPSVKSIKFLMQYAGK